MKTNVICDFFKNHTRVIETKKKRNASSFKK